jgi:CRP-like cAMP-binding protein
LLAPEDVDIARELLAGVPMFHNLNRAGIAELATMLRRRDMSRGETVIRRDEPAVCMYLIAYGEVEVDLPQHPSKLLSGAFFGESALFGGTPRGVIAKTKRPTKLFCLYADDFRTFIDRQPELASMIEIPDSAETTS